MNQIVTRAIVLSRVNYGEADRIVTVLTPDQGKLRLMARGVRKAKSKLAGGIELFSVSDITFIRGRGDIGTLVSARLDTHYGQIVQHLDRTMAGYDLIKQLNRATEDEPESAYFDILELAIQSLNIPLLPEPLIRAWFTAQLLVLAGHTPNLRTDRYGKPLDVSRRYIFSFDDMAFMSHERGNFDANRIKFLRLLFSNNEPEVLAGVHDAHRYTTDCLPIIQSIATEYLRF